MDKPERPDFEYYRKAAVNGQDLERLASELIDLVYEAREYIEYLEGQIKEKEE
jgi:hypothetical protein